MQNYIYIPIVSSDASKCSGSIQPSPLLLAIISVTLSKVGSLVSREFEDEDGRQEKPEEARTTQMEPFQKKIAGAGSGSDLVNDKMGLCQH